MSALPLLYREDLERELAAMQVREGLAPASNRLDPLQFVAACHDTKLVEVAYYDGAMHLRCSVCTRLIAAVPVQARDTKE